MDARRYNESQVQQARALKALRTRSIAKMDWEGQHDLRGGRLAPTIEKLRNAHGFTIEGDGSVKKPYRMPDKMQLPGRVEVTEKMKQAYWDSPHWRAIRTARLEYDNHTCRLCGSNAEQVHHIKYELFAERHWHCMSVCIRCHEEIHANNGPRFPSGMSVEHARRLGFEPKWDNWLVPQVREDLFA